MFFSVLLIISSYIAGWISEGTDKNKELSGKLFDEDKKKRGIANKDEELRDFGYTFYHIIWHVMASVSLSLIFMYIHSNNVKVNQ